MRVLHKIITFTLLALFFQNLWAEEGESKRVEDREEIERIALTEIMVVAVGPRPGRRFNTKGQVLLPAVGETPPAKLHFKGNSAGEPNAGWQALSVAFNSSPAFRSIAADKALVLYRKNRASGNYEKYVALPPGVVGGRRVFFLTPANINAKPWDEKPLVRVLNLDSKRLQRKKLIIKNLSRFTVRHTFERSVATVRPMKTISYGDKSEKLYRLNAYYGIQKKVIYNTALKFDASGGMHFFVFYNARAETNAGREVGVFRMMIPVRGELP